MLTVYDKKKTRHSQYYPAMFKNSKYYALNRLEIIAKRGIIARLSKNTSFRLYEKVRKGRFFNFLAAIQKVACYRVLHILMESRLAYINGVRTKLFSSKPWRKMTRHYGKKAGVFHPKFGSNNLFSLYHSRGPTNESAIIWK